VLAVAAAGILEFTTTAFVAITPACAGTIPSSGRVLMRGRFLLGAANKEVSQYQTWCMTLGIASLSGVQNE
jgi:hypothetical protein